MSLKLKAIYRDGAFVPITNGEKLNVPENAEVEITVHDPYVVLLRQRVTKNVNVPCVN